jgi:hypothetical protein
MYGATEVVNGKLYSDMLQVIDMTLNASPQGITGKRLECEILYGVRDEGGGT